VIVQFASNQIDSLVAQNQFMVDGYDRMIAQVREPAEQEQRELTVDETNRITGLETMSEPFRTQLDMFDGWARPLKTVELFVPKTGDVQKIIANICGAPTLNELVQSSGAMDSEAIKPPEFDDEQWKQIQEAGVVGAQAVREVNTATSLSSSLAVTALILALATFIFTRRDF
ncbi:MAG: hypothetical protein ACYTGC_08900, partial [Planctomycetota bacterium]|jgi:hypothetical protein